MFRAYFFSLLLSLLALTGCSSSPMSGDDTSGMEGMHEPATNIIADDGSYSYVTTDVDTHKELLGNEPHAVYFHASWCIADRKLKPKVTSNIESFPTGTKILELDFDDEEALRREYGIVQQTSFLVFDSEGNIVDKLVIPSLDKLKKTIAESL